MQLQYKDIFRNARQIQNSKASTFGKGKRSRIIKIVNAGEAKRWGLQGFNRKVGLVKAQKLSIHHDLPKSNQFINVKLWLSSAITRGRMSTMGGGHECRYLGGGGRPRPTARANRVAAAVVLLLWLVPGCLPLL
ncbi:hypothetical protein SLE2022_172820 [Rubroshorea leprosula]